MAGRQFAESRCAAGSISLRPGSEFYLDLLVLAIQFTDHASYVSKFRVIAFKAFGVYAFIVHCKFRHQVAAASRVVVVGTPEETRTLSRNRDGSEKKRVDQTRFRFDVSGRT